jgi:hypothetical protein
LNESRLALKQNLTFKGNFYGFVSLGLIQEIRNVGRWIWNFLHCGQRPGRVKRVRSSNTYPHVKQIAGVSNTVLFWDATERTM